MKTAAELFRQKIVRGNQQSAKPNDELNAAGAGPRSTLSEPPESQQPSAGGDLDEEIRRLEAELAQDDDDDDDDDSSEDDSTSRSSEIRTDDNCNSDSAATPGIVNLSQLQEERIECLPHSALPALARQDTKNNKRTAPNSDPAPSKRKRAPVSTAPNGTSSTGLASAVQDFLRGYRARSAERLPFYCRVCARQYDSETEFVHHQTLPPHQTAVALDRKASYCKLCRKQLTSPAQLKEHLQSRPHQERLDFMKAKQQRSGGRRPNGASTRPN